MVFYALLCIAYFPLIFMFSMKISTQTRPTFYCYYRCPILCEQSLLSDVQFVMGKRHHPDRHHHPFHFSTKAGIRRDRLTEGSTRLYSYTVKPVFMISIAS